MVEMLEVPPDDEAAPGPEVGDKPDGDEADGAMTPDDRRRMRLDEYLQTKIQYVTASLKLRRHELNMGRLCMAFLSPDIAMCSPQGDRPWGSVLVENPSERSDESQDAREMARIAAYERLTRIFAGDMVGPDYFREMQTAAAVVADQFDINNAEEERDGA